MAFEVRKMDEKKVVDMLFRLETALIAEHAIANRFREALGDAAIGVSHAYLTNAELEASARELSSREGNHCGRTTLDASRRMRASLQSGETN